MKIILVCFPCAKIFFYNEKKITVESILVYILYECH